MTNDEIELPEPDEYLGAGWSVEEVLLAQQYARAAVRAERERAQAAGIRAWATDDGRVISTAQKEQSLRDGGASASSVAPYSIPLVAASAQAAEPVATMHVGMFGSTGFTGLDAGAKLPEGDYPLYTALPARPAVTEEMLDRAEAAVVMQMCSDDNGDREIARAAIEAALGGGHGD